MLKGNNTNKKQVSIYLSLWPLDQLQINKGEQPMSLLWEYEGIWLWTPGAVWLCPITPDPHLSVRKRVVNLLRLTPGFVSDVYLVCKKCFYLVSKYVWAHRVMMLLYWSGRETMVEGYKCWPQLPPTPHSISLFHSEPPLPCSISPLHTDMHDQTLACTQTCTFSLTNSHTHMLGSCCSIVTPCGPFGFCSCLLCIGPPGHS